MAAPRTVLFLCTGNYYRSRFAEILFNHLAARSGLPWRAESRGVAIEFGVNNVGPISAEVLRHVEALGVPPDGHLRLPRQLAEADLRRADLVIALKQAEHGPLLRERFPGWAERVRFWNIHDTDAGTVGEALAGIEREVAALAAELRAAGG